MPTDPSTTPQVLVYGPESLTGTHTTKRVQYDITAALAAADPTMLTGFFHNGHEKKARTLALSPLAQRLGTVEIESTQTAWAIDFLALDEWLVQHRPLLITQMLLDGFLPLLPEGSTLAETFDLAREQIEHFDFGLPNHTLALRALDGLYLLAVTAPATPAREALTGAENIAKSGLLTYRRARLFMQAGIAVAEARDLVDRSVDDSEIEVLAALR